MSAVRDLPKLPLGESPTAQHCDCGYDFVSRRMEASSLGKQDANNEITLLETFLSIFLPVIGFCFGLMARQAGRTEAGNKMMIVSVLVMFVPLLLFGVFAIAAR